VEVSNGGKEVSTFGIAPPYAGAIEGLRLKKEANHLRGGFGEEDREGEEGPGDAGRDGEEGRLVERGDAALEPDCLSERFFREKRCRKSINFSRFL